MVKVLTKLNYSAKEMTTHNEQRRVYRISIK